MENTWNLEDEMLSAMETLAMDGVSIMSGEGGASEFYEFVRNNGFNSEMDIEDAAQLTYDVFLENEDELERLYNQYSVNESPESFSNRDTLGRGYNVNTGEGQVAVSQALSHEFGLSDERVARIMGTSKRTVFNYRHARRGSNVTPWDNRPPENQKVAIARARKLMGE